MKTFSAKVLRGFAYVWFAIAFTLILTAVGFEFYRGGFWHGFDKVTEWFSPFNVFGFIVILITFSPGLLALWGAEKLKSQS